MKSSARKKDYCALLTTRVHNICIFCSHSVDLQRKMGYRDLKTVKEFILRKSYQDDDLTGDEERFLDSLNRQVMIVDNAPRLFAREQSDFNIRVVVSFCVT